METPVGPVLAHPSIHPSVCLNLDFRSLYMKRRAFGLKRFPAKMMPEIHIWQPHEVQA